MSNRKALVEGLLSGKVGPKATVQLDPHQMAMILGAIGVLAVILWKR